MEVSKAYKTDFASVCGHPVVQEAVAASMNNVCIILPNYSQLAPGAFRQRLDALAQAKAGPAEPGSAPKPAKPV